MRVADPGRGAPPAQLLVALSIVAVGVGGVVAGRGSVVRHPEARHP
ncbi:MAG: hypothetical protein JWO02_928, partial [Solirubrobacterales bacterium]|nr:hypothetical protein [Solirubrobacterales bacterium]